MYNVMIIDDREAFRREISRMKYFREHSEELKITHSAQNGQEALDILGQEHIDIVLTDIRMPIMDGLELLGEIKRNNLCECTILVSEYSDFKYAREGIIKGAFDYIVKPATEDEVRRVFDRALSFLKTSVKQPTALSNLVKVTTSVLINKRDSRDESIELLLKGIFDSADEPEDRCNMASYAMSDICGYLLKEIPSLENYIPLKQIAYVDAGISEEKVLESLIRKRLDVICKQLDKIIIKTDSKIITDICNYVLENVDKKLNLQMITDEFFLNKKYLSSMFNKQTGHHYIDYVTDIKIERAKMLLSYSDNKIYEIAVSLGFSDAEYFSKVFKKKTGISPSDFKWEDYI